MNQAEPYSFTRRQLIQALQTKPVTAVLSMLESQGGCPEDLADAIIKALDGSQLG